MPFPPPGDLPHPGIELTLPAAPALAHVLLTSAPPGNNLGLRYPTIKNGRAKFPFVDLKDAGELQVKFYLGQMRPAARKTALQIVLRDCSKGAVGEGHYIRFQ